MKLDMYPPRWLTALLLPVALSWFVSACRPTQSLDGNGNAGRSAPAEMVAEETNVSEASGEIDLNHEHEEETHHHHAPPHGGTLLVLGEHVGHIEVLHDAAEGTLTLFVLDGHAEGPIRIDAPHFFLEVTLDGATPFEVRALPQANALTGETQGDSSEFKIVDERLKNVQRFRGRLAPLTLRGTQFPALEFAFPEGNE
jgi:hypothetical protein